MGRLFSLCCIGIIVGLTAAADPVFRVATFNVENYLSIPTGTRPAKSAAAKGTAKAKRAPRAPGLDIGIAQLRESLEHSVTLSRERIQEVVDDAVKRGRMTHGDAEKMIGELLKRGRKQTDALLSELEGLLRQARRKLP